jgi:hypothetical protein
MLPNRDAKTTVITSRPDMASDAATGQAAMDKMSQKFCEPGSEVYMDMQSRKTARSD